MSKNTVLSAAIAAAFALPLSAHAAPVDAKELEAIREQIRQMKQSYEARLQALHEATPFLAALAWATDTEIFRVHKLGNGETVVALDQVELLARIRDARLAVGDSRGLARGDVELRRPPRGDPQLHRPPRAAAPRRLRVLRPRARRAGSARPRPRGARPAVPGPRPR